jgi:hypothetical protein
MDMNNQETCQETNEETASENIIGDPVGYLAQFGIDAELMAETALPAAA